MIALLHLYNVISKYAINYELFPCRYREKLQLFPTSNMMHPSKVQTSFILLYYITVIHEFINEAEEHDHPHKNFVLQPAIELPSPPYPESLLLGIPISM